LGETGNFFGVNLVDLGVVDEGFGVNNVVRNKNGKTVDFVLGKVSRKGL